MRKKELTEAEKKDLQMKMEIAEELGLLEKVERSAESWDSGKLKNEKKLYIMKKKFRTEKTIAFIYACKD